MLGVAAAMAVADTASNPYQSILARNIFNLKDPVPPQPPAVPAPPPTPMPTVKLKGITTILSTKRAILEITEPGKKGGAESKIFIEGDRKESVEVITIDDDQNFVKVKIGDTETNLTFEKVESAKAGPAAPAPGALPVFRPPGFPRPSIPRPTAINPAGAAAASPSGSSVFVMGSGGNPAPAASGSSVMTFGASDTASGGTIPTVPNRTTATAVPGFTPRTTYGVPSIPTTTGAGLRTIPTRPIRTEVQPRTTSTAPPITREQHTLLLDLNRISNEGKGFPPIPGASMLTPPQPAGNQPAGQ